MHQHLQECGRDVAGARAGGQDATGGSCHDASRGQQAAAPPTNGNKLQCPMAEGRKPTRAHPDRLSLEGSIGEGGSGRGCRHEKNASTCVHMLLDVGTYRGLERLHVAVRDLVHQPSELVFLTVNYSTSVRIFMNYVAFYCIIISASVRIHMHQYASKRM